MNTGILLELEREFALVEHSSEWLGADVVCLREIAVGFHLFAC
jgi:hypothetical protein